MREFVDYYAVLEVGPDASPDEIKRCYRRLVRENHPDIAPDPDAAHERMQLILSAYGVLSDPTSRARYDRESARQDGQLPSKNDSYSDTHESYSRPSRDGTMRSTTSSSVPVPEVVRRARAAQNMRHAREGSTRGENPRTRLLTTVFEAAQMFFLEERAAEAIALCHKVLKEDPRNPEAAALLGDMYLAQDRKDMALPMFERAMLAQPSNLLYKQKWNALRRGEPVPASTFRPPTMADTANEVSSTSSSTGSVSSEPTAEVPHVGETVRQDLRSRLGIVGEGPEPVPSKPPEKPKAKPILGKLFGRGK